jgi:hypothetical protein
MGSAQRRYPLAGRCHPYAVVALVEDDRSPWHGGPVFSAWVVEPENARDD